VPSLLTGVVHNEEMSRGLGVTIGFTQVVCRCGIMRTAAVKCVDCGLVPKPHEINLEVQRRRIFVGKIKSALAMSIAEDLKSRQPFLDMQYAADILDSWSAGFWLRISVDEPDVSDIVEHINSLRSAIRVLGKVPRLRPWRSLLRTLKEHADHTSSAFEKALELYSAMTPIAAQKLQREMQQQLYIAQELEDLFSAEISELVSLNEGGVEGRVLLVAAAHMSDLKGLSAAKRLVSKVDKSIQIPAGTLEFIGICARMAQMVGEEAEFIEIASGALDLLMTNPEKAAEGISGNGFREAFKLSLAESYSSGKIVQLVVAAAINDQTMIDSFLDLAHSMVESASRPQVAVLASCLVHKGYRRVIEGGASGAIALLKNGGWERLVSGLSVDLRNAKAHRSYRISKDRIFLEVLKDNGNVKSVMSGADLADSLISAQITTLGLLVGCYLGALSTNSDAPGLFGGIDSFPLDVSCQVAYIMAGWVEPEVKIDVENSTFTVFGCPPISVDLPGTPEFDNFIIATSVAPSMPDSIERLIFHDGQEDHIELSLVTARRVRDTEIPDDLERVSILCEVRRGRQRAMTNGGLRLLLGGLAGRATMLEPVAGLLRLRQIQKFANQQQDFELVAEIKGMMSSIRSKIK